MPPRSGLRPEAGFIELPPVSYRLQSEHQPTLPVELTSVRHLEECGIRTAADFVGAQVDYLSVRRTAYVIRRDGTPLQIRGLGAERALGLSAWRQWIDAGRAPVFA